MAVVAFVSLRAVPVRLGDVDLDGENFMRVRSEMRGIMRGREMGGGGRKRIRRRAGEVGGRMGLSWEGSGEEMPLLILCLD